jgi:hypothetical protein
MALSSVLGTEALTSPAALTWCLISLRPETMATDLNIILNQGGYVKCGDDKVVAM